MLIAGLLAANLALFHWVERTGLYYLLGEFARYVYAYEGLTAIISEAILINDFWVLRSISKKKYVITGKTIMLFYDEIKGNGKKRVVGRKQKNRRQTIAAASLAIFLFMLNPLAVSSTVSYTATVSITPSLGWWNSDWSYRKPITVDHNYIGSDLTDFPMLIYEIDSDLANHAQSDLDDVCFVTWDNSIKLDHEIEEYNSSTGYIVAWVRINLTVTSDTRFWMYYGNSVCSSQQNPTGVWNSNFVMVQHLNEASGTHFDSTLNDNNGAPSSNLDQGVSAKIDGGDYFNGTSGEADYISWSGSDFNFDYDDSFTFELWMKSNTGGTFPFAKGNDNKGYRLKLHKDGDLNFQMKVNGASRQIRRRVDALARDNAWHYVVITYNGSRDVSGLTIYVDLYIPTTQGTRNTVQAGDSMQTDRVFYIGRNSGGTAYWYEGYIDEFRISNATRNVDWLNATYWSTRSPSNFYSIGSEEGN